MENAKKQMVLRKNYFGIFEHPETGLLFNRDEEENCLYVFGKMNNDDGLICKLNENDIQKCIELGLSYSLILTITIRTTLFIKSIMS